MITIMIQVRGWRETPIFARSSWWRSQRHPVVLPAPICELLDIIEHFTGTQATMHVARDAIRIIS